MRKLVNLKDNNDILVPKVVPSVDVNDLLISNKTIKNFTWTATKDCLINFYTFAYANIKINNVYYDRSENESKLYGTLFIKANDVVEFEGAFDGNYLIAYGLRY